MSKAAGSRRRPVTKSGWRGVFAALVTPMDRHQDVDHERLAAFTEYLIGAGVHGLIPLGSTGEYYALDAQERQEVLRTVLDTAAGRVPVIAGANAGATRHVIEYCHQAQEMGCAGVMLAAPYYSLPRPEELHAHFKAVNDAIDIPIMIYNYPGRTGVDMPPEFLARLARLRNVRYVKDSTGELPRIAQIRRLSGDSLVVFCGCDTIALPALLAGAAGWVGGVANVVPSGHVRTYELAVERQDYAGAAAAFERLLPLLELMEGCGKYTQFVKHGCAAMGHDCGPPRQPLLPPTAGERRLLEAALARCRGLERAPTTGARRSR
jgi:4-hydroxy-tetrahydrodipicolinate synthase